MAAVTALPARSRQAVSLSSRLQSEHRKMRISVSPPATGTIAIRFISAVQGQSGSSVEPASSRRSNFDMTPPFPSQSVCPSISLVRESLRIIRSALASFGTRVRLPTPKSLVSAAGAQRQPRGAADRSEYRQAGRAIAPVRSTGSRYLVLPAIRRGSSRASSFAA